ncbi:hypothetical protein KC354_g10339 [Hortaea werneckii]|nr:hypothetical protein KC354_g10339 [Hortaea werneckii]
MGASESKLAFKEDVFRLAREDNIDPADRWWCQFYQLPETAEDVFALWSPNDVRNLTINHAADRPPPGTQIAPKKNLETLMYTCIGRLHALQTRRCYSDPHQPITSEVLNCIRILTRLLPYIYEADHLQDWEDTFFWKPRKHTQVWDRKRERMGPYFDGLTNKRYSVSSEKEDSVPDADAGGDGGPEDPAVKVIGPPLGEQLIDILMGYMFFPGFTLPKRVNAEGLPELKIHYNIWNSGIGCRQSAGMTKENERNAVEVMRLLVSLCSKQLYMSAHVVADRDARPLSYLTTYPEKQVVLSVLCSLMNTVLKYNPATWRVPIDFSIDGDPKAKLVNLSLQFLLLLILYPDTADESNQFRRSLSRLHRVEDFQFIQQGLTTVLTQPVSGLPSYLPGRQVPWAPETLVFFWELLQVNKRFRAFIIETDRAHDFVVLVLYYAMSVKDEPTKQGIVRMCVLILQTMSVEPHFGDRLNKAFVGQETLPSVLRIQNFHGSYADFLITSVHSLMTTTGGRLESIYPALLAIIGNVAPYCKNLQRATSSKLLDLFVQMSSPKFLLEKETNHTMLQLLLQAMNAILEHQFEANPRFVEVIVRSQKRFEALRDFTVEGALAELDRQTQERKDRGVADVQPTGVRSPARHGSIDGIRGPASARSSTQLEHVPEHGRFAIGDDDDDDNDDDHEDDDEMRRSSTSLSAVRSSSASLVEDAMPMQSRSMSEKARGKQPVGQGSFSRSTSRNTSTASLPALNTLQANSAAPNLPLMQFRPTPEWLETWLPYLNLHPILTVLEDVSASDTTAVPTPTAEFTSRLTNEEASPPSAQAFQWTSLSLGWYISLLWGLIYASDANSNKGINGIWTGTNIKLFSIVASSAHGAVSLSSPKGAVDAVGDSIARRISSLSFKGPASASSQQASPVGGRDG